MSTSTTPPPHISRRFFAGLSPRLLAGLIVCGAPAVARAQDAPPAAPAAPAAETPAAPVAAPVETSASPELLRRLDDLDQRVRITDRKLELVQEAAAQKPVTAAVTADEKGFGITSADKAYDLHVRGLIQFDARRIFGTSDYSLQDKDTFLLRRARPIIDATVLGLVDFRLAPDFGNNTTALYDAYVDAHPTPWLRLRGGKFKPPIGLERLQSDANLSLAERALDSNLSAQRDVGLELWGDVANAALHYELAIFNGNPDGGLNDIDNEHAKTYAGRLFLRPFQLEGLHSFGDLGVGFAAETGNEKGGSALVSGAASNTWLPTFKTAGQNTIFTYTSSTTDLTQTVFAHHRHTRLNPQLYYYVGGFGLLGEWVREFQDVDKGATTASVNNQAGHVTVSWVFGGANGYDGVRPTKAADWATKDIGAVELAFRYNWLDVDNVAFQGSTLASAATSVTAAQGWGVGLNWWLSRNIKVMGTWDQTSFTGGAGTSKAVTDRPTEKMGFARFQVNF
jgi:phosphate-selective porin OprO and OprP